MKFKSMLVTAFALLVGAISTASADEKIKVMYLGVPQVGPSVVHAQNFAKQLKTPYTFISQKDCAASMDYLKANTDVVYLLASTNAMTQKKHGVDCTPKFEPTDLVYVADNYFHLCRKPGSKKDIMRERFTIAGASVLPLMGIANDYNIQNGMSMIAVPVQSSDQVITSILNEDVDYGMIITTAADPQVASGKLECPYTTNPKAENYVGKKFRLAMPDYKIRWLMAIKSSDPAVRSEITRAAQSKDYTDSLTKLGYVNIRNTNLDQSDIDRWNTWIDDNLKTYLK